MSKKEKYGVSDFDSGSFAENYDGPVYYTPDHVRHPERYPELTKRLGELARELWHEEEEKK